LHKEERNPRKRGVKEYRLRKVEIGENGLASSLAIRQIEEGGLHEGLWHRCLEQLDGEDI
jgi:hypothetical protein